MIVLTLFLFCLIVVLGTGALAAWSDIKGMTIPNIYSVIIALSFAFCFAVSALFGAPLFIHIGSYLISGGLIFAVSVAMFFLGVMGAADSKLASAFALWIPLHILPPFLFYMAVVGGLLGGITILLKKYKPLKAPMAGSWMDQVQQGANKVPYGVAIYVGALVAFWFAGYFDPQLYIGLARS